MNLVMQLGAQGKTLDRLRKEMEARKLEQEGKDKSVDGNEGGDGEGPPDGEENGMLDGDALADMVSKKTRKRKKFCHTATLEKLRMKFIKNDDIIAERMELVQVVFTRFKESRKYFDYEP
jgi:hypothetical protein